MQDTLVYTVQNHGVDTEIETKYGKVKLTLYSDSAARLHTDSQDTFLVNNGLYRFYVELHRNADGQWVWGSSTQKHSYNYFRSAVYMRRKFDEIPASKRGQSNDDHPSDSVYNKAKEELEKTVLTLLANGSLDHMLKIAQNRHCDAGRQRLTNAVEKAKKALSEAESDLAAYDATVQAISSQERELLNTLDFNQWHRVYNPNETHLATLKMLEARGLIELNDLSTTHNQHFNFKMTTLGEAVRG